MDELDEMFNQMLKNMIHMFVYTAAENWGKWFKPLLFVQEVPQTSVGFLPI